MIVSFSRQFVFIAVPKVATHAVRCVLRPFLAPSDWEQCTCFEKRFFPVGELAAMGHGHLTADQFKPYLLPGMWDSFFKFCFVRHPFDRFASYCYFALQDQQAMLKNPVETMKSVIRREVKKVHLLPQSEFITGQCGELEVDFVGRYENLQSDFNVVCRRLGLPLNDLPAINGSPRALTREEKWDGELKDLVYDYYRVDFEAFGYSPSSFSV